MKSCLDLDTLTSVGQALDWDLDQLPHLHECAECREQLEHLTSIHADLSREEAVHPGFSADVMAAISQHATEDRTVGWMGLLNPVLAGMAAVAVAWAARPSFWALAGSAVVAGIVTWGWDRRQRDSGIGGTPPPAA